jgi:hypothetical protein
MRKAVIANWGSANQGKSDTIKRLTQMILLHYPNATTQPQNINYTGDIKVIITIGRIHIGIESQGDPGSRIFESLDEFAAQHCDAIICSTRTSGATVGAVNTLHHVHGYDIIWVTNHRSNEKNQNTLNTFSAEQHFELLQNLMSGRI